MWLESLRLHASLVTILALFASPAQAARTLLTHTQLIVGSPALTATVPLDSAFVADHEANQIPADQFDGTLKITSSTVSVPWSDCNRTLVPDGCDEAYLFPSSTTIGFDLVQNGRDVIPVRRDPIAIRDSGWWDLILQPGRAWRELADQGYTRIALPFALEEKDANCLHNGVMTFLFRSGPKPHISRVAIEITTETCLYNRFDMVGLLTATYTPKSLPDKTAIIANYAAEVAARMPTRPLSQLAKDFPTLALDPANLRIGSPAHNTVYGLVVMHNGTYTHYVSDCHTRNGNYPYCDVLALPSYSLAKSVYAGVALMRLQMLHPGAKDQLISRYITAPTCKPGSAAKWSDVSFDDALNMATGNFTDATLNSDEDKRMTGLFAATTDVGKTRFSWCSFPRAATPGSTFAYHTSDTYLLGRAMQAYLQMLPGDARKDLFTDIVVGEVYAPLGLSATARFSRRTWGRGDPRQTFTGWGLAFTRDDVVRLAKFLSIDHGAIDGVQKLDRSMLDEALQRTTPQPNGLATGDASGKLWYSHGFWASNLQEPLGCTNPVFVPAMSGYGGITVALFPAVNGGVIYYNFADEGPAADPGDPDNVFRWSKPALEAFRFGNFCSR